LSHRLGFCQAKLGYSVCYGALQKPVSHTAVLWIGCLRFTGLKVLCLTRLNICPIMDSPDELWTLGDCRKNMQEFVDSHKDSYVGGKAPEVQVRYWDREEWRSLYSTPETKVARRN
jgi:hypothetical protein